MRHVELAMVVVVKVCVLEKVVILVNTVTAPLENVPHQKQIFPLYCGWNMQVALLRMQFDATTNH
jgi:hypothetical protein